jgi:hypothetical protein
LAKDHGFLSDGADLTVELAHLDARAHRVAQVRPEQLQPVSRQKVADSLGPQPLVGLPGYRTVLRAQPDESVSAPLLVLRAWPQPAHQKAREPVPWEQFSEQLVRQREASRHELREPLVSPQAQKSQRGPRASRRPEPHALAGVQLQAREAASAPLSRPLPLLLFRP